MSEEEENGGKKYNMSALNLIEICRIQEELNCTDSGFSLDLGYSASVMAGWKAVGKAPMVAVLAAQYLLSEARKEERKFILTVTNGTSVKVENPNIRDVITLNGDTYMKI